MCNLNLNSSKCIIASQKRHPVVPVYKLHIGDDNIILEQVESYRYLGVTITSKLDWTQYINHVATKARKLVGMQYRKYYTWTDTPVLRCLYLTCIRPHLEYACQLWDPFTQNGINTLESVQKCACKICLKRWDLDYDSMLAQLNIPKLTTRRKYLKLTTMYNITRGNYYFPSGFFCTKLQ